MQENKDIVYHSLQRFIDRIWKRIYRDRLKCECSHCQCNFIDIFDRSHAEYLFDCQNDMYIEYRDKTLP